MGGNWVIALILKLWEITWEQQEQCNQKKHQNERKVTEVKLPHIDAAVQRKMAL